MKQLELPIDVEQSEKGLYNRALSIAYEALEYVAKTTDGKVAMRQKAVEALEKIRVHAKVR